MNYRRINGNGDGTGYVGIARILINIIDGLMGIKVGQEMDNWIS